MKSVGTKCAEVRAQISEKASILYLKGYLVVSISFIATAGMGKDKGFDCVYEGDTFKSLVELVSASPLKGDANFRVD